MNNINNEYNVISGNIKVNERINIKSINIILNRKPPLQLPTVRLVRVSSRSMVPQLILLNQIS